MVVAPHRGVRNTHASDGRGPWHAGETLLGTELGPGAGVRRGRERLVPTLRDEARLGIRLHSRDLLGRALQSY